MTFLSGPNSVGNPVEIETPVPLGPRNCVQSSAATVTSDNDAIINAKGMYLIFDIEKSMRCYLVERSRVFNAVRWILVDGRRKRKEDLSRGSMLIPATEDYVRQGRAAES